MKMKFNKYLVVSALCNLGLVTADFFEGADRAELFELVDLNMPTIHINFSDEAYNRFQLTYKCLYDTHPSVDNYNEDCFKAPWVNYNEVITALIQDNVIDSTRLTLEHQQMINNPEMTYEEFYDIVISSSTITVKDIFSQRYSYVVIPSFEEKKASLDFTLDNQTVTKENVKLTIGGKYTQIFEKPQYNINIKDNEGLFGRNQLRLRSEVIDPSFIRSKIGSDLTDLLGLPSIEASYTKLFINDDDMGLYLIRDAFKPQWIEANFNEPNTTSLYKCDAEYGSSLFFNCVNEDTEEVDADFTDFITRLENTQTVEELSEFFDVDLYIKWQAYKYLTGSWDHVTVQHNQYLYKNGNKWMNLLYDYDSDFGAYKTPDPEQTFTEQSLEMSFPLYQIIGLGEDHPQLIAYIKEMVVKGFNPVKLLPRIDELINYLYPYIVEDRSPSDDSVARPGHFARPNYKIENSFTVDDFLKNAEYHNYFLKKYYTSTAYDTDEIYGLKRWVVERFRFVCSHYQMDCSFASEYLEGGSFELPSKLSTEVIIEEHQQGCNESGYPCCKNNDGDIFAVDGAGEWGIEGSVWCLYDRPVGTATSSSAVAECWSLEQGYPCCKEATEVLFTSENGEQWSMENDNWCGIIPTKVIRTPKNLPPNMPKPSHGKKSYSKY